MWPFRKRECARCKEIEERIVRLTHLDFRADETDPMILNAAFDGAAVKLWAAAAAHWFRETGAPNVIVMDMSDPKTGQAFQLTMQRAGGKSPATVIGDLRALLKDLSDDISEPVHAHYSGKYVEVQMSPELISKLRKEVAASSAESKEA